jgi:pyruvate,water dikinase
VILRQISIELEGGAKYEIKEENQMLGWRGASRDTSQWCHKAFRIECKAIRRYSDEWGLKNL